jgi:hypothetical protein
MQGNAPSAYSSLPTNAFKKLSYPKGSLKAEEFKRLVNIYSEHVVADNLPPAEARAWMKLVQASRILSEHRVRRSDLPRAELLMKEFIDGIKALHPTLPLPPNFHLCQHLGEMVLLHGPMPCVWW